MSVHKAEPTDAMKLAHDRDACVHCHEPIHKVPGGHGMTWVHTPSGAVAGFLPDDEDAVTQQHERAAQEAIAYLWVHEHMPAEEVQALARFVDNNPRQRGIQWWDAMSIMRDCDAHLDTVEPMAEAIKDEGGEWTVLHTFVTYTILYASRAFYNMPVEQRVIHLRATIENNSR